MQTYKDLLAQKKELDQLIEKAHKQESAAALAEIKALVKDFGFTAQQVFPWKPETKVKAPVKYYDPSTGSKWSGRGKPPRWIQGKDYSQFLLNVEISDSLVPEEA